MPNCDQLSVEISQLAFDIAAVTGLKNVDAVVREMRKIEGLENVPRDMVVDAINAVTEGKKQGLDDATAAVAAVKRDAKMDPALRKAIDGLDAHLKRGTLPEARERAQDYAGETVRRLREVRDQLKKEINQSPAAVKKRLTEGIKRAEKRLADNDFAPPQQKPRMQTDELQRLAFEKRKLDKQVRKRIDDMKPKTWWDRSGREIVDIPRAMVASVDLSGVGRQGLVGAITNPKAGIKALGQMFRAVRSERDMDAVLQRMNDDPMMPMAADAKLELTNIDNINITGKEEYFRSTFAERIPGLGRLVKASERAYVSYLNVLRFEMFKSLVHTLGKNGEVTQQEAAQIAHWVNVATGRGKRFAGVAGDVLFFSQKYTASRFQLLFGGPLWMSEGRARRQIAIEYAKMLTGIGLMYGLFAAFDDKGDAIETDPRSTDFMKIKVGNTRIDPWAGLQQVFVLTSQALTGERKTTTGKLIDLRKEGFKFDDVRSRLSRGLLWYKLAPTASTITNLLAGESAVGEKRNLYTKEGLIGEKGDYGNLGVLGDIAVPLAVRDIIDVFEEHDIPAATGLSLLAIFGVGVQTYDQRPTSSRRKRRR